MKKIKINIEDASFGCDVEAIREVPDVLVPFFQELFEELSDDWLISTVEVIDEA